MRVLDDLAGDLDVLCEGNFIVLVYKQDDLVIILRPAAIEHVIL